MRQNRGSCSGFFIFAAQAPLEFCDDNPQRRIINCENKKWFINETDRCWGTRKWWQQAGGDVAWSLQPWKHKWALTEEQKTLTAITADRWTVLTDSFSRPLFAGAAWTFYKREPQPVDFGLGWLIRKAGWKKNLTAGWTFLSSVCLWTRSEWHFFIPSLCSWSPPTGRSGSTSASWCLSSRRRR